MSMTSLNRLLEADSLEVQVEAMQASINDGSVWHMEGNLGRTAMVFLRAGWCTLGEVGHRDFWGNYIPSRTEVKPGTLGSVEYCRARNWGN
jgi:hypothetical protein